MTVTRIPIHTEHYQGLSGDDKPTSVPIGSTFYATDTLALYVTPDGGTTWVLADNAIRDTFGGAIYHETDTAVADTARRFETTSKKLRDVVITVTTYAQLFGTSAAQAYPVAAGDTVGFTKVDISTLYFKNAAAGENGVVIILAVEE